jgi:hypothetical protein
MKSIIKNGEILPMPEKRIIDTGISSEIISINEKLINLCINFKERDKSDIPNDIYDLLKTFDKALVLTNARLKIANQNLLNESLISGSRGSYFNQEEIKKNILNGGKGGEKSVSVKKEDAHFEPICLILKECITNNDYRIFQAMESINLLLSISSILDYIQSEHLEKCPFCSPLKESIQDNTSYINLYKLNSEMLRNKSKENYCYKVIKDLILNNSKSKRTIENWKKFYKQNEFRGFTNSHLS